MNLGPRGSVKSGRFEALLDQRVAVQMELEPVCPENAAAPVDRPCAQIAEEIKRRQITLAVRYIAALRAR
jgi:hypothetical protein